jgi:small subunit ribosomal protein S17
VQEEQDQQKTEETQEPAVETEPAAEAEPAPADETGADETAADESAGEAEAAAEEPAAEAPAESEPAEPAEQLSPSERRKRARATAPHEQRPPRSAQERAGERAEQRAARAVARRRWRAKRREKARAAGPRGEATPVPAREPGVRKIQQGVVVSSKADKTITVRIDRVGRHRVYGKVVRQSSTLHAHDERNEAGEGDVVRVVEARPLSRTKRWRLVKVLEKAR